MTNSQFLQSLLLAILHFNFVQPQKVWIEDTFHDFNNGHLDAAGQNLYVSRNGTIRTIHRFDLNQDGFLDLIFNNTHDTIGYLPGTVASVDPNSSIRQIPLAVEGSKRVAVGDLNRDGYPDLVLCPNHGGIQNPRRLLTIVWGGDDGWPSSRSNGILPVYGPINAVIADLNRDDWPDIVTLNRKAWLRGQPSGNILRIFWGGPRGYLLNRRLDLGVENALNLVAHDLDRDGALDVAVLTQNSILIFWSGPIADDPTILESTHVYLPGKGLCIAADDINQDSNPDLVIGTDQNELYMVLGRPGRDFDQSQSFFGFPSSHISTGHLDDDVWPDLVLVDLPLSRAGGGEIAGAGRNQNLVRVLWGSSSGYSKKEHLELHAPFASASAIGDLNGDGQNDLALAHYQGSTSFTTHSWLYWGKGNRSLEKAADGIGTSGATDVAIVGPQATNKGHVIFSNSRGGTVDEKVPLQVYWGSPRGFSPDSVWEIPFQSGYESSAADLNADGFTDLIVLNSGHGGVTTLSSPTLGANILWGSKNGLTLDSRTVLREHNLASSNVADLDKDGYLDLILGAFNDPKFRTTAHLLVYYGGSQGFDRSRRTAIPSPGRSTGCVVADFNRDQWLDIAVSSTMENRTRLFWGGPQGFDQERQDSVDAPWPISMETADLNKDGFLDLLVGSYHDPLEGHRDTGSLIYWGNKGGFQSWNSQWLPGFTPIGMAVADWDKDGYLDVFSPHYHSELTRESLPCYLYWGGPNGLGTRNRTILNCDSAHDSLAGDFDRDGRLDLAISCHTKDGDHKTLSRVYYNDGNRFVQPRVQFLPTIGTHWMGDQDMGHIYHRRWEQTYESSIFHWNRAARNVTLEYRADLPKGTRLTFELRSSDRRETLPRISWSRFYGPAPLQNNHRFLQYRATFYSDNGDRYPVLDQVKISLE